MLDASKQFAATSKDHDGKGEYLYTHPVQDFPPMLNGLWRPLDEDEKGAGASIDSAPSSPDFPMNSTKHQRLNLLIRTRNGFHFRINQRSIVRRGRCISRVVDNASRRAWRHN
jgi:hypothetical protein